MTNDFKLTKDFNLKEFQCPCCGTVKIDSKLVKRLQELRDGIDKPIIVTSGYRCPAHNKEVGGVNSSYHTKGLAVDITVDNMELEDLLIKAKMVGFKGIGIYTLKNFLHLDLGPERAWYG